jgi:hypothetical protein
MYKTILRRVSKLILCSFALVCLSSCRSARLQSIPSAGCKLAIPAGWTIERIDAPFFKPQDAFGMKWPGWHKVIAENEDDYEIGDFPIYASVYEGSLEASGKEYGWTNEAGTWWIEGKSRTEALHVKGQAREFLRGESAVGLRAKPGSEYYGSVGATAFVAVVDGLKGKIVVLIADPFFDDKAIFDMIADSVRFE